MFAALVAMAGQMAISEEVSLLSSLKKKKAMGRGIEKEEKAESLTDHLESLIDVVMKTKKKKTMEKTKGEEEEEDEGDQREKRGRFQLEEWRLMKPLIQEMRSLDANLGSFDDVDDGADDEDEDGDVFVVLLPLLLPLLLAVVSV